MDEASVPHVLLCPITHGIMIGPEAASDGHTCERPAIQEWFVQGHNTGPTTNLRLANTTPAPCHAVRVTSIIVSWRQGRGGSAGQQNTQRSTPRMFSRPRHL